MRDTLEFWDSLAYSLNMAAHSQHTNVALSIHRFIFEGTIDVVVQRISSLENSPTRNLTCYVIGLGLVIILNDEKNLAASFVDFSLRLIPTITS